KFRDDAGDAAAVIEHAIGHRAHQSVRAAAIDQADAVLGQDLAERAGSFDETGISAGTGTAINTDSLDLVHAGHVALQRKRRQAGVERSRGDRTYPQIPSIPEGFADGQGCNNAPKPLYDLPHK